MKGIQIFHNITMKKCPKVGKLLSQIKVFLTEELISQLTHNCFKKIKRNTNNKEIEWTVNVAVHEECKIYLTFQENILQPRLVFLRNGNNLWQT